MRGCTIMPVAKELGEQAPGRRIVVAKPFTRKGVILAQQRSEPYVKALGTFMAIVLMLFLASAGLVGCNNGVGTTWRPDLDPGISAPGKL
jgi:hypothetical protein